MKRIGLHYSALIGAPLEVVCRLSQVLSSYRIAAITSLGATVSSSDMNDRAAIAIRKVLTANPNEDRTQVILEVSTEGEKNVALSIPIEELAPLVALISQAATLAYRIAGTTPDQEVLETDDTLVFQDAENVDIHFRLVGGLALPLGLTSEGAAKLREQLNAPQAGDKRRKTKH